MLPIVNWNERAEEFPATSVSLIAPDSAGLRESIRRALNGTSVEYLGAGFNNAHHVVHTLGGQRIVVRRALAPVPALRIRLDREYAVLQILQEHHYSHSPHAVGQFAEGVIDACPAYAMTFVDGAAWSGTAENARALGQAAAALHRLPLDELPSACGDELEPVAIVDRLCGRLRRNLNEVGSHMTSDHRARVTDLLEVLPCKLAAIDWNGSRAVLVHGDLGDHNVRFVEGRAVLLDWEFAALADPLFDLMWFAARDGVWANHLPSFLDGYADTKIESRLNQLRLLRDLALVELALWAQSGLDDLSAGINGHFFRSQDRMFLERQVERIEEAVA